jgi:hypothetical protein
MRERDDLKGKCKVREKRDSDMFTSFHREKEKEKKGRACFKHARNTHTRILVITQPRSQMQVGTDGPKRVEKYPTSTTQMEREKDLITYSFVINLLPIDIFSSLSLSFFFCLFCSYVAGPPSTSLFCHFHLKSKIEYKRQKRRKPELIFSSSWGC